MARPCRPSLALETSYPSSLRLSSKGMRMLSSSSIIRILAMSAFLSLRKRQPNRKHAALSRLAFDLDFPPVGLDDFLDQGQPQAAPLDRPRQFVAAPEEALEHPVDVFLLDADAEVPHGDGKRRSLDGGADHHFSRIPGILDSVVDEVGDGLPQRGAGDCNEGNRAL